MSEARCPSREQLQQYLSGVLAGNDAEAVAPHVEACPDCQAAVQTLHDAGGTRAEPPPLPPKKLPDLSVSESALPGQLGEYKLLEKLGEGGMGVVYRAVHVELDRVVALKVMRAERVADEQAIGRFKREIKAVGRLDHPHLVRAHDARQIDGTHFLVTEFVDGLDLAELVRRLGPLPIADACELARQIALGLQYVHEHGMVHRDIKPSNVILSRSGVAKILDLGLARIRAVPAVGEGVTSAGLAIGTPEYMAPEQASDSHGADIRADVYSLGCTLYTLLTGRAPFCGAAYRTAFDKMMAHAREPVPPVRGIRSDVPKAVVAVVDQMLAKNPDDRFQTPAQVAEALGRSTSGSDLVALVARGQGRPPTASGASKPTVGPPRRHRRRSSPWLLGAGAFLAVCAICALVSLLVINRDAGNDMEPRPPTPPAEDPGVAAERDLPGWIVLSWTLEGIGKPNLWLFRPDGSQRFQVTDDPRSFDIHPSFSPDGRQIAFIRGQDFEHSTSVWVAGADGSGARPVVSASSDDERFLSPVWLSNSRLLYTRDPKIDRMPDVELRAVDLDGGEPERLFRFGDALIGASGAATDVSPDGGQLALIAQRRGLWPTADVYLTDLEGRAVEDLWRDDPGDRKDARALWSADGGRIAWHHNFTRGGLAEHYYYGIGLARRETDGSWTCRLQPEPEARVTPLAWSPDDRSLLCARMAPDEKRATLLLMDDRFQTARELFELEVHSWQPGERDFGRLGDWAIVPGDVALPRPR